MSTRIKLLIAGAVIALGVGITWAILSMNAWEEDCVNSGGHVESEFLGFIQTPIMDGKGNIVGWNQIPNYAYYCRDASGQEIEVSR